jgi:nitrate/TMAO reductase-like tetraheme cytochrome c subunit
MTQSADPQPSAKPDAKKAGRPWRRRLKQLLIGAGVVCVILVGAAIGTEHYTSRPEFCGTCHVMDPYYKSWSSDIHAESAACVTCHYAPGEQHTFKAKFRGLSQVVSYFSGRYGAARPRARVQDASCLTSPCHGDQAYMTKEIHLGTVTFVHAKHLDPDSEMLERRRTQLVDLRSTLRTALGDEALAEIEAIAQIIQPARVRRAQLVKWIAERGLSDWQEDVLALGDLVHIELRLDQLAGLKCASCHQFDATTRKHFVANLATCYTCHFMEQPFNQATGRCLACHEPPTQTITIHGAATTPATVPATPPHKMVTIVDAADGTSPPVSVVTMDHQTIIANNVNCVSCHVDLIHGSGDVTRRDCESCHDQARYLKDLDKRSVDVVREYHRVHAAGQRARCNDCHRLIRHELVPLDPTAGPAALLGPVRQDCEHCHPSRHREQVEMLLGRGGFSGSVPALPNPMTGSRANCRACHTQPGDDPEGAEVLRSTAASCRGCPGDEYETVFATWRQGIQARLDEARTLHQQVQKRLATATLPAGDTARVQELVNRSGRNIDLVYRANGLHNRNYALVLLDQAMSDLDEAQSLLPTP